MAAGGGSGRARKPHRPFIPPEMSLPEMTAKAVILGIILALIMSAANAYLGLYVGMTVSAAIPAAVMFMAIMRGLSKAGLVRSGTILESNLGKTIAAAGEALAAGVIFTFPALLLMLDESGKPIWTELNYYVVWIVAALGGTLGVLFSISLRRILIIEQELPYPEGIAAAEVLKAGEETGKGFTYVFGALVIGMLFRLGTALQTVKGTVSLGLWGSRLGGTFKLGARTQIQIGSEYSSALLGVGYIIGFRIALIVFLGGMTGWFIALPIISTFTPDGFIFDATTRVRFFGVGTMLVGGMYTLWTIRAAIIKGIKEAVGAIFGKRVDMSTLPRHERDIPPQFALISAGVLSIPIIIVFYYLSKSVLIAIVAGLVMVVAAYLFSAIAGYLAGIVGSSNNPLSGVTIIVLLFTSILLYLLGARGVMGMAAVIGVGAVVACSASIAGDNLQDLKSGWILGSTPWKLQLSLIIGVVSSSFVIPLVVNVLHRAYGIGVGLQAPQAFLMKSITEGVFKGNMDWIMVVSGIVLGIALIILSRRLRLTFSVMAFAVGIYLPWYMSTPIMIGGVAKLIVDRRVDSRLRPVPFGLEDRERESFQEEAALAREEAHNNGVLFGSGLIAGEALMGVILAALVVSGHSIAVVQGAPAWPGMFIFLYMASLVGYVAWRELDKPEYKERFRRVLR
jgi:putative OPT family oligopeptide transporter